MAFFCGFLEAKVVNLGPIDLQLGLPINLLLEIMGRANLKSISPKMGITRAFLSNFDIRPLQND